MSKKNDRLREIIEIKGDLPPEEERAAEMISDHWVRGSRHPGTYESKKTDATNPRLIKKKATTGE